MSALSILNGEDHDDLRQTLTELIEADGCEAVALRQSAPASGSPDAPTCPVNDPTPS